MAAKGPLSVLLLIAIFLIAAGAIYVSFSLRRTEVREQQSADKLPGVEGLNEGEVVNLPTLSTLAGESIPLGQLKENRVLCVFFSPSCSGCTKDVELWRDLKDESIKRGVAFYIIDVGNDNEALKKLVAAYKLEALPILFDPNHRIGPTLKSISCLHTCCLQVTVRSCIDGMELENTSERRASNNSKSFSSTTVIKC